MKFLIASFILFLVSCTPSEKREPSSSAPVATDTSCEHDARTFKCVKFIKNYDADTITFHIPNVHPLLGDKISVRVNGVDAAEMKGHHPCEKQRAVEARDLINETLRKAKRIDLQNVQRDKYFRILADVSADGVDIKDLLFKNRLVYEYHGETKQAINWCSMGRTPASR